MPLALSFLLRQGAIASAVLLVLAAIWFEEILRRLPTDLRELRRGEEAGGKVAIVVLWIVTALIAACVPLLARGLFDGT